MYKIKRQSIGSGSFGTVHKLTVTNKSSPSPYAEVIKVFTDAYHFDSAINEATILKQLRGLPNIVQFKQFVHTNNGLKHPHTILTKLSQEDSPIANHMICARVIANLFQFSPVLIIGLDCYQNDLRTLMNNIWPSEWPRYNLLAQTNLEFVATGVARGLYYLRHYKIVHGDLKPNNILVNYTTKSDQPNNIVFTDVRICDFNISWTLTQSQVLENMLPIDRKLSIKQYRAPELSFDILQAQKNKIDMWSYGCLLYEFATRSFLFPDGFKNAYWNYFNKGYNVIYEKTEKTEETEETSPKKIKLETTPIDLTDMQQIDNLNSNLNAILANVPRIFNGHFSVTTTQKIQIYPRKNNSLLFRPENAKILDICLGCFEVNPAWRITPDIVLGKLGAELPVVEQTNKLDAVNNVELDKVNKLLFESKKIIAKHIYCSNLADIKIFVHFECILNRYVLHLTNEGKVIDLTNENLLYACLFIAHAFDFSRSINGLLSFKMESEKFDPIYNIICNIMDSGCDLLLGDSEPRVTKYINLLRTEQLINEKNTTDLKFVDLFIDVETNARF